MYRALALQAVMKYNLSLLYPFSLIPTDMAETLRYLLVGSGEITGESVEVKLKCARRRLD